MVNPINIKGEKTWVTYYDAGGNLVGVITSKENNRDLYYLYEIVDNVYKKVAKAHSSLELEEKYLKKI